MTEWVENVVSKWKTEGVKINEGASLADVEALELFLDFKFPADFKDFYLAMNGFKSLDWQEHMFHFWSLEMIIEEFNDSKEKDFIGFCDFFLSSNFIGFSKCKAGVYKVYPSIHDAEMELIATTFEEVVGMINSNTGLIY
jgi:hypothetical protein